MMLYHMIICEYCGGKIRPPGSSLHSDPGCYCVEGSKNKRKREVAEKEQQEWEKVTTRRNRRTFIVGG